MHSRPPALHATGPIPGARYTSSSPRHSLCGVSTRRRSSGLATSASSPSKGAGYGIEEGYSEICWFYDLDATPSMPEGPIAVNVFARLHDADAFLAVCRRMRLEGAKRVEITPA